MSGICLKAQGKFQKDQTMLYFWIKEFLRTKHLPLSIGIQKNSEFSNGSLFEQEKENQRKFIFLPNNRYAI